MPPQQSQTDLSPEDAKASLGIATTLQDQLLGNAGEQEAPTTPQNEPGTQDSPENRVDVKEEISGLETRLMDELQTLREEMKTQGDGKKELEDLKAQIEKILNSD